MFEMSVFERMIHLKALVVGLVVAIPMTIAHMLQGVDAPAFLAVLLGRGGALFAALGGIGDAPLIGARRIRSVLIVFLFASLLVRATILGALCEGWDC